jgi:hypothetical protein
MDRVLKNALNLDRHEKPAPFEVVLEDTPKESSTSDSQSTSTEAEQPNSSENVQSENKESSEQL